MVLDRHRARVPGSLLVPASLVTVNQRQSHTHNHGYVSQLLVSDSIVDADILALICSDLQGLAGALSGPTLSSLSKEGVLGTCRRKRGKPPAVLP
jgi:hypothetical protein